MAATVKCDTIVNASSATNNLALDASGNVTVGAGLTVGSGLTLTGGALTVGGSAGTSGQILKSNGTTSSWVNGWTLVNTITGTSAAALQDTTSLTSTYANYMIYFRNITTATNAVTVYLQVYSGGAYQTTSYSSWAGFGYIAASSATTYMLISRPAYYNNSYPLIGTVYVNNPSSTSAYKTFQGTTGYYDTNWSGAMNGGVCSIWTGGTGAITGFQVLASSGNISGTIQIYGSN